MRSPVIAITLPKKVSQEEMIFLSPTQIANLAEVITPCYSTMIYTAAYTGLRVGELAALQIERVNVLKGVVDVVESRSEVNGHLHVGPTKTGARRSISLPRFLAEMLGEHIGRHASRDGYVFPRPRVYRREGGTSTADTTRWPRGFRDQQREGE